MSDVGESWAAAERDEAFRSLVAGARARAGNPAPLACHDCGLNVLLPWLKTGESADCPRCGKGLRRVVSGTLDKTLALAVTALVCLCISLAEPFLDMEIAGIKVTADLTTGIWELAAQGFYELAVLVAFTTVIAPLSFIVCLIALLVGLKIREPGPSLRLLNRAVRALRPWSMIEVYMLGVLVSFTKLADLATLIFAPGFYAVAGVMVTMVAIDAVLDEHELSQTLERSRVESRPVDHHQRKPNSLVRTWALVIAAAIFFVPANLYPVLSIFALGQGLPSTIFGGVEELLLGGLWPLALIVFCASIMVPLLKIVGLIFLLVLTQRGSAWRLRDRTRIYRLIEAIGRWSMIDVFVVSILTGLVQVGSIATIVPHAGATCFSLVVVLTMFAAARFDPRLMWDRAGQNQPREVA